MLIMSVFTVMALSGLLGLWCWWKRLAGSTDPTIEILSRSPGWSLGEIQRFTEHASCRQSVRGRVALMLHLGLHLGGTAFTKAPWQRLTGPLPSLSLCQGDKVTEVTIPPKGLVLHPHDAQSTPTGTAFSCWASN